MESRQKIIIVFPKQKKNRLSSNSRHKHSDAWRKNCACSGPALGNKTITQFDRNVFPYLFFSPRFSKPYSSTSFAVGRDNSVRLSQSSFVSSSRWCIKNNDIKIKWKIPIVTIFVSRVGALSDTCTKELIVC